MASGSGRWPWASWTITRGTVRHLQWYLSETTEDLVHGLSQGIQKCGLPRALMTDNGSAMVAEEFTEGLLRLGILHETTLALQRLSERKARDLSGRTWKDA